MPPSKARSDASKGQPNLTERQILEAALNIVRSEGVDALSMRRLSRELDRSAMAVYYYVRDKSQLLDLVARAALAEVPTPDASGPWTERLKVVIRGVETQLRSYPGLGDVLLDRMLSTHMSVLNSIMEVLLSAGFSDRDVLLSYAAIHTYLFGRTRTFDGPQRHRYHPSDADLDNLTGTLAMVTRSLPDLHGTDFFEYGLDVLVRGLASRLESSS